MASGSRRRSVGALGLAGVLAMTGALTGRAFAQSPFPNRSIEMVIPFAAGGTSDVVGRIIAAALAKDFGVPVVVTNRLGAAGTIGIKSVARAPADGYTIGIGGTSSLAIAPHLMKPSPYDPLRDLTPLGIAATAPFILVVNPKLNVSTPKELIALAKEHPGTLNFGTSGIGSTHHVMTEYFNNLAGIKTTHIPFKGGAENVNNLLAGNIDFMFESSSSILALVKANKVCAIAVSGKSRLSELPGVPTMRESGLPDFVVESVIGVVAPAWLPGSVLVRMTQALEKALATPAVRDAIQNIGSEPGSGGMAEFTSLLKSENIRWQQTISTAKIAEN